jgi:type I restriction enzyme, S subunit
MNWPLVLLDSVAERGSGHTPSQKHPEYWNDGIKWVSLADSSALDRRYIFDTAKKISELGLRHSSAVLHPKGTVILSRDAGVGKSAILGEEMAVSQHFIVWRCDGKRLCSEYLYQWLQSEKIEFERIATGSTVKTIGLGHFQKLRLPLPPIEEQKRIASALDTWDNAIQRTDQLIAAKERHYSHELSRLMSRGQHPHGHVGTVPEEVSTRKRSGKLAALGDILSESRDPDTDQDTAKRLTVRLHLQGVEARPVRGTESDGATAYFRRRAGQLIYGKQNIFRGAIGLIPPELDGYCSTQDLPAFDIGADVDPEWLYYCLSRKGFYGSLESLAAGSGSKRLHPEEFFKVRITLPAFAVQTAIARYLNALREEIGLLGQFVTALKTQKCGLMQKLLTGKGQLPVRDEISA